MKILHLHLKPLKDEYVELHYFWDNPNDYQSRNLHLEAISDLIQQTETDYYTYLPVDYAITGQKLYNWLDGNERFLQQALDQYRQDGLILAISAAEQLAHLPWEVLHDGNGFLVQKLPGIIPVRWVAGKERKLSIETKPENRALNVLFMATSPLGVKPILDFEGEEGRILEATKRQPLALTVEESGCLEELGYLVEDSGENYFDIFHLTGHATFAEGKPRFITETQTGEANYASGEDIARELQFQLPRLIFLSGCRTGQGSVGKRRQEGQGEAVPSMAESLLEAGTKVVLGWGQKVLDSNATEAAATLYQGLSAGKKLSVAMAETYQELIRNKARDWHLLRLYVRESLPGSLVTPLRQRRGQPRPQPSVTTRFLDPAGKIKVPTRESFVGRRRQLQNCLRALKSPSDKLGVLIHGMGGLGKSSLAARLCDRLTDFTSIISVGRWDEGSLVKGLGEKLGNQELREILQGEGEELKFRLQQVFKRYEDSPFLLVLDDFEGNLDSRNGGYILESEVVKVLEALVWAIEESYAPHRIIITSRYDFATQELSSFYKQPLEALQGADLRKKCNRLTAFEEESEVDKALQSQGKRLADGNPRLLEWLDKVLRNLEKPKSLSKGTEEEAKESVQEILSHLEKDPVELREKILAKSLLAQMNTAIKEMLAKGLVFELPVPREALTTVIVGTKDESEISEQIERTIALGLLEVSPDQSLRVPRILPVELPKEIEALSKRGTEILYRLWWEEGEGTTEEQALEIHRLAIKGKAETIAIDIADRVTSLWNSKSRYREIVKTCQETLEITQDYRILHNSARAEEKLGDVNQALKHYQQALKFCPSEDEKNKAAIVHNLAGLYTQQGQVEEAIALYQQSLELEERIGDVRGKAATLHAMAGIYAQQGQVEEALALYQQSLELQERIGNVGGKAATLHQMAGIYAQQGQVEEAIALYQQSLELQERIGNVRGKAATLHEMAGIYAQQGQVEEAIALYQQSLELKERIGDVRGKAATLHEMAGIYAQQGQVEEAIALYQQSLELKERIGDVRGKAATLAMMGQLLAHETGDFDTGLAYLNASLQIFQHLRSPESQTVQEIIQRIQMLRLQQSPEMREVLQQLQSFTEQTNSDSINEEQLAQFFKSLDEEKRALLLQLFKFS